MLGSLPSNIVDYVDFNRFAELLCDTGQTAVTDTSALDALPRAKNLVRTAEGIICQACRCKQVYSLQELRDLVIDFQTPAGTISGTGADAHEVGISGGQLMQLIADVTWCQLIKRRRFTKESPQGQDPSCERSEESLTQLRNGERIFVLDGVVIHTGTTDTGTWYGSEVSEAGLLHAGTMADSGINCAPHLWGCKINRGCGPGTGSTNPCC